VTDILKEDHQSAHMNMRQYVDMRFEMQEKAVSAALVAAERAVNKAEASTEKRLESMNEFRGALSDSARLLMPRPEAEQSFRVLSEKIEHLEKRVNARDDRGRGGADVWALILAAAAIIASVGGLLIRVSH
jgi:UDP-N-acetylmuramoylalanine-D-glutamate ligase